jgi:hypothetical protein
MPHFEPGLKVRCLGAPESLARPVRIQHVHGPSLLPSSLPHDHDLAVCPVAWQIAPGFAADFVGFKVTDALPFAGSSEWPGRRAAA